MSKGGYLSLNLRDTAITTGGAAVTIAGLHSAIKNNYRKMTVLSRLKLDGVEFPDTPVLFVPSGNNYIGIVNTVAAHGVSATFSVMTVANTDAVTVAAAVVTQ